MAAVAPKTDIVRLAFLRIAIRQGKTQRTFWSGIAGGEAKHCGGQKQTNNFVHNFYLRDVVSERETSTIPIPQRLKTTTEQAPPD